MRRVRCLLAAVALAVLSPAAWAQEGDAAGVAQPETVEQLDALRDQLQAERLRQLISRVQRDMGPFLERLLAKYNLAQYDLVVSLYNQKELWPKFGYEGSSAEHGGYIKRGFADIDWLPKA